MDYKQRVLKYVLSSRDMTLDCRAPMPLSIGMQGDQVVVWIREDAQEDLRKSTIRITAVATGEEFPNGSLFIGTVQLDNEWKQRLVWHVFWRPVVDLPPDHDKVDYP